MNVGRPQQPTALNPARWTIRFNLLRPSETLPAACRNSRFILQGARRWGVLVVLVMARRNASVAATQNSYSRAKQLVRETLFLSLEARLPTFSNPGLLV